MKLSMLRLTGAKLGYALAACVAIEVLALATAIAAHNPAPVFLFVPGVWLGAHLVDDVHGGGAFLALTFVTTTVLLLPPVYLILSLILGLVRKRQPESE